MQIAEVLAVPPPGGGGSYSAPGSYSVRGSYIASIWIFQKMGAPSFQETVLYRQPGRRRFGITLIIRVKLTLCAHFVAFIPDGITVRCQHGLVELSMFLHQLFIQLSLTILKLSNVLHLINFGIISY